MREVGVRIMAGSDVGVLNVFPGWSVSEELELLVKEVGMTPIAALRSATSAPAEFIGIGKKTGSIEVGKSADLVLLDANPLRDIHHLRRVRAIVLRGRLFHRPALERLLESVADAEDRQVNDWPGDSLSGTDR
jgi:imidazolonepropionase-like amidohydrolase